MSFQTTAPLTGQVTANVVQNRPLVLNEGQMFHGQIKQLYPGQMAEIQIGGQKMFAKLEVPMKAGDSYYFQVSTVKPELQLKIVSGPLQATEGQARQLSGLMDAMQLPKTPEMQALLTFVMKNKIPMTRDNLIEAEVLLKGVPAEARNEALASIQKMAELKLPFTETVFRSLLGVEKKEGLHAILNALKNALVADFSVSSKVKSTILAALDKMAKPFTQATGGALLGQSLLTLLDSAERPETKFATLQMLKGAGVLPERSSLANLQQVFTTLLTADSAVRSTALQQQPGGLDVSGNREAVHSVGASSASASTVQQMLAVLRQIGTGHQAQLTDSLASLKALVSSESTMNAQQKTALTSMIERAASTPLIVESTTKFVAEFSQAVIRVTAENAVAAPFQVTGSSAGVLSLLGQQTPQQGAEKLATLVKMGENSDNVAIQKLVQAAEVAVASAVNGKAVREALQTVIGSFGLNYEAGLLGKEPDFGRLTESLKPQLLALMQDPSLSLALRDAAETVVMRMNGPLLQSGENGVQHQLVMQVPLEFFGKRIDLTLQWNGRMKEDGKIDPDFARILFYLDLQSIDKTVIDMQVQNRVVSVTVFNADNTLKAVGAPLQHRLKEGLESVGYKLSSVFFKDFVEEEKKMSKKKSRLETDGQGVDFRI